MELTQYRGLASFHQAWKKEVEGLSDFEHRIDWLTDSTIVLVQQAIGFGNESYHQLNQENLTTDELYEIYSVTFDWAEWCKLFVLLMRDTLFEQQKAVLFLNDNIYTQDQLQQLWENSKTVLKEALMSIDSNVLNATQEPKKDKIVRRRKHHDNPWPVFKKQLLTIDKQLQLLRKDFKNLSAIQLLMHQIEGFIKDVVQTCQNEITIAQSQISKVVQLVNSKEFLDSPKIVFSKLNKITEEIKLDLPLDVFKDRSNELLHQFSNPISPIIAINGGSVKQRDFIPQKNVTQWLESEVYPLLYEMWEVTESGVVGFRMVLVNLSNRIQVLIKEKQETELKNSENLLQSLIDFQKNITHANDTLLDTQKQLSERLEAEFKIRFLFDESHYFLPVSLQSTLNEKFWNNENSLLAQGRVLLHRAVKQLRKIKENAYKEQTLSVAEKIANCIQQRQLIEEDNNYTNIFLTKGYVGESFFVGRSQELERIQKLISNWDNGFRGSVLLTGNRFSGKTIFAEIVAQRYFAHNFYRLLPEQTLDVKGRKLQTTHNLEEALEFVCKYNTNNRLLILIDDLELWWSPEIPFYQNIQSLTEYIDWYSDKFFFVVTTNSSIKKQLYTFTHLERIFQAEVDLNMVDINTMQKAVAIRHGATHKKIVDVDGEILSVPAFNKLVNLIHRSVSGNIGDTLSAWANSMILVDEKSVKNAFETYQKLPTFLNEDNRIVLRIILLHKRVNEYRLRQLLGAAFSVRYATVVRRLMHIGILRRQLDSYIELEASVANDIKVLLDEE